ncbi:uncharacterized protein LOC110056012 isoform X3 [Orbicella faveolata]|nr:uncharacterized protein LOC110056012 isoform X3 [Orbicella faveolata]
MPPVPGNAGVPPRLPLPRDGFSTRQYLTSLAQSGTLETDNDSTVSPRTDTSQGAWTPTSSLPTGHSNVNPVIQLTIEDDADLQQSPFENSVIVLDQIQGNSFF